MERYRFPKAPFEKAEIQSFVAALEAELHDAEAADGDVDGLRMVQQESIDGYAAALSEEDATEFLLMCAAERLFLQKDSPAEQQARGKDALANQAGGWMNLSLRLLDLTRALRNLDVRLTSPAVVGISIGVILLIVVLMRAYVLFFS